MQTRADRANGTADRRARLAQWLRDGRMQRKWSLDDVARVTKIQPRILEKLEAGALDGLPADVFVRGFVRSVARCLGLDEHEALERYTDCAPGARMPTSPSSPAADAVRSAANPADSAPVASAKTAANPAEPAPAASGKTAAVAAHDRRSRKNRRAARRMAALTALAGTRSGALPPRNRPRPAMSPPRPDASPTALGVVSARAAASVPVGLPLAAGSAGAVRASTTAVEMMGMSATPEVRVAPVASASRGLAWALASAAPGTSWTRGGSAPTAAAPSTSAPTAPNPPPHRPITPSRRPVAPMHVVPILVIDDADPDAADFEREAREVARSPSRGSFLPSILLDRDDKSTRQGPLTLAVVVLFIAATLLLCYLMRQPSHLGDGMTTSSKR